MSVSDYNGSLHFNGSFCTWHQRSNSQVATMHKAYCDNHKAGVTATTTCCCEQTLCMIYIKTGKITMFFFIISAHLTLCTYIRSMFRALNYIGALLFLVTERCLTWKAMVQQQHKWLQSVVCTLAAIMSVMLPRVTPNRGHSDRLFRVLNVDLVMEYMN